ncbi:unnamed protein product [Arabidopsis halleri]
MYRVSNFFHIFAAVVSPETSRMTSSSRHNMIVECAFSSMTAISAASPFPLLSFDNGAHKPCCFNRACILICQRLKLFLPENLSIFTFIVDISSPKLQNAEFPEPDSARNFFCTDFARIFFCTDLHGFCTKLFLPEICTKLIQPENCTNRRKKKTLCSDTNFAQT